MIYPKKINASKTDKVMKALLISSVVLSGILLLINKLTSNKISWSALSIAGIIYVWITVIYSIKKNTNIAGHVLIQTIAISCLTVFIDYQIGFRRLVNRYFNTNNFNCSKYNNVNFNNSKLQEIYKICNISINNCII